MRIAGFLCSAIFQSAIVLRRFSVTWRNVLLREERKKQKDIERRRKREYNRGETARKCE